MKRLLIYAAFALGIFSCTYGDNNTAQSNEDTTSPASGATGQGLDGTGTSSMGTGNDTTGIDMGAVMPLDSATNTRPIADEPGADKSHVDGKINNAGGGTSGGQ